MALEKQLDYLQFTPGEDVGAESLEDAAHVLLDHLPSPVRALRILPRGAVVGVGL
jgi:hypothetical protein